MFEHLEVLADRRARESLLGRHSRERSLQRAERFEIERRVAPLDDLHAFERVALQRFDEFRLEYRAAPGGAEGAVAGVAAGAAGDLAELRRREAAELITVELAVGRERDVIDVEVEPHTDRVGRDQIIDVTGLIEGYLRVARARREGAEHDGGAAALTPDQFGDGVNLVGRERDDRGAARQARELLLARIGEPRQP